MSSHLKSEVRARKTRKTRALRPARQCHRCNKQSGVTRSQVQRSSGNKTGKVVKELCRGSKFGLFLHKEGIVSCNF